MKNGNFGELTTSAPKWLPKGIKKRDEPKLSFPIDSVYFDWSKQVKISKSSANKTLDRELRYIKSSTDFQVCLCDKKIYVVFGKYKLQRNHLYAGGLVFLFGLAAAAKGFRFPATILLGAGGSSFIDAWKKDALDFDPKENLKQAVIGAVTELVTGGFRSLKPFASLGSSLSIKTLEAMSTGLLGYITSVKLTLLLEDAASDKSNGKDLRLSLRDAIIAILSSGISPIASKIACAFVPTNLIKNIAIQIIAQAAAEGAAGGFASQLLRNILEGQDFSKDILLTMLHNGLVAGAYAVPEANRIAEEIAKISEQEKDVAGKIVSAEEYLEYLADLLKALKEQVEGTNEDFELKNMSIEEIKAAINTYQQELNTLNEQKDNLARSKYNLYKYHLGRLRATHLKEFKKFIKDCCDVQFERNGETSLKRRGSDLGDTPKEAALYILKKVAKGWTVRFYGDKGKEKFEFKPPFLDSCNKIKNKIEINKQAIENREKAIELSSQEITIRQKIDSTPSTPANVVTTPANVVTIPANVETTQANVVTTPAKVVTTPANVETTPANVETTPANVVTIPANVETTQANVVTTPAKVVTTPANVETTPANVETTPANVVTTPANVVTTPAKVVTTPANVVTIPANVGSTPPKVGTQKYFSKRVPPEAYSVRYTPSSNPKAHLLDNEISSDTHKEEIIKANILQHQDKLTLDEEYGIKGILDDGISSDTHEEEITKANILQHQEGILDDGIKSDTSEEEITEANILQHQEGILGLLRSKKEANSALRENLETRAREVYDKFGGKFIEYIEQGCEIYWGGTEDSEKVNKTDATKKYAIKISLEIALGKTIIFTHNKDGKVIETEYAYNSKFSGCGLVNHDLALNKEKLGKCDYKLKQKMKGIEAYYESKEPIMQEDLVVNPGVIPVAGLAPVVGPVANPAVALDALVTAVGNLIPIAPITFIAPATMTPVAPVVGPNPVVILPLRSRSEKEKKWNTIINQIKKREMELGTLRLEAAKCCDGQKHAKHIRINIIEGQITNLWNDLAKL